MRSVVMGVASSFLLALPSAAQTVATPPVPDGTVTDWEMRRYFGRI